MTAVAAAQAPSGTVRAAPPAVSVEGLAKRYGTLTAVEDVSFTVDAGEAVALLGPNGAGKTTTVKTLVGLVRPSAGQVRVFGRPPTEPEVRADLGYLPELFRFPEWLTGRQVLAVHARLARVPPHRRSQRIDDVLALVGLGGRGAERVRGYSKGMAQRLGLAQAVLAEPPLVLLDEPTSALDPLGRLLVRDVIRDLTASGAAVLLNTHLLGEAESVCDRVVVLDHGRVRWTGSPHGLPGRSARLRVRVDRPGAELPAVLARFGEVAPAGDGAMHVTVAAAGVAAEVAAAVVAAGYGLLELVAERRSLEDVYVQLVSESEQ